MICTVLFDLLSEDVNLYCEILVNCGKINTIIVLVRLTDKYQIRLSVSTLVKLYTFDFFLTKLL